ncbi:heparinase II/III domain-containing protein [Spirosoma flavum]|uniref:Heparinase II/III family protein n=1 Tax=Spirosoma flavum TaxID=2048557 RepID=A0ABW6AEZ3_9BACT
MNNPGLFWRTVRHLTPRQLLFQVLTRVRSRPKLHFSKTSPTTHFITAGKADKPVSWQAGTFTFLNKSYSPPPSLINWNYGNAKPTNYGKLWTYNLNYFDFLNQPDLPPDTGLTLIHDFIAQTDSLGDGLDSYPTSLRIINWIQFLSRNQIQCDATNSHLAAQTDLLSRRLEYHIAGNHLLENGYALLISSLFFRHKYWYRTAAQIIRAELKKQILSDGGHDERSSMYHQRLLDQLLTVLLALQHDVWYKEQDADLVGFLSYKACQILNWLNAITFRNGDVPMVNDSAFGIAPTTAQLQKKAASVIQSSAGFVTLQTTLATATLQESGYRMFRFGRYELFVDIGPIGPDHQPGHAHADTFSFVLYVDNFPLIVDNGLSTYQIGPRRELERSTSAHNTVAVNGCNSSEVWAGFRVGNRARVTVLTDTKTRLKAHHDGYYRFGVVHERAWFIEPTRFIIHDQLIRGRGKSKVDQSGIARFHFHPTVQIQILGDMLISGPLQMSFSSESKPSLYITKYDMAEGFNKLRTGHCLNVVFTNSLETTIIPTP